MFLVISLIYREQRPFQISSCGGTRKSGFHGNPRTEAGNWVWIQGHSRNLRCRSSRIFPLLFYCSCYSVLFYVYTSFYLALITVSAYLYNFYFPIILAYMWSIIASQVLILLTNFQLKLPPVTEKFFLCSLGPTLTWLN